jgi:hypothetical protein
VVVTVDISQTEDTQEPLSTPQERVPH